MGSGTSELLNPGSGQAAEQDHKAGLVSRHVGTTNEEGMWDGGHSWSRWKVLLKPRDFRSTLTINYRQ